MMTSTITYDFSYTGYALRIKEMSKIARFILTDQSFDVVNELGSGKTTTAQRSLSEIKKRLDVLTEKQRIILLDGDLISQKQIVFLAICKLHYFMRDFTIEVLREKYLVFDVQFTEGEFISFVRRKREIHQNLDEKSDTAIYKIRKVTFQILEEAGIIDSVKDKNIQPQILDNQVIEAIVEDDPEWLKIFLMSDSDIIDSIKDKWKI